MNPHQRALKDLLQQLEFFSELHHENPFKIRAYAKVQELIGELSESDFQEHWEEENWTELKGIGKGIAQVIQEFKERQSSSELEALWKIYPKSLYELRQIKGLGAKKIRVLFETLQIQSVGELEYACNENRLLSLPGFGEKTQSKVLSEILLLKKHQGFSLLSDSLQVAARLEKKFPKNRVWVAVGALGAKKETMDQLDYLFAYEKNSRSKPNWLSKLGLETQQKREADSSEFRFCDIQTPEAQKLRFWFCEAEEFSVASVFLSSSRSHWEFLKGRAKARSLELSPRALTRGSKRLDLKSDRELYSQLELDYAPAEAREFPELRPKLVERSEIQGVFHAHSLYSDGRHSLAEMAQACKERGWKYLGISEHSKTAVYAQGLERKRLQDQWTEIDQWNRQNKELKILKGIESDILKDGNLDYPKEVLKGFDFVIASIHQRYGQKDMTDRLLKALKNPYTRMLGHLSGRLLLSREAYAFDKERVFRESIESKVVIELNANPHRLDLDWRDCFDACRQGLLISINPDAHSIEALDDLDYGIWMARKALVPPSQIINTWSLAKLEEFFREARV
ncbi:MAG: DNA polymerase/3'-5' exonuclease PolX [Bradymonadales bacterium]|nr:MAG: DNA polymerase/3'-5' exonuclease PolX [Bradymonadales bacterium]